MLAARVGMLAARFAMLRARGEVLAVGRAGRAVGDHRGGLAGVGGFIARATLTHDRSSFIIQHSAFPPRAAVKDIPTFLRLSSV